MITFSKCSIFWFSFSWVSLSKRWYWCKISRKIQVIRIIHIYDNFLQVLHIFIFFIFFFLGQSLSFSSCRSTRAFPAPSDLVLLFGSSSSLPLVSPLVSRGFIRRRKECASLGLVISWKGPAEGEDRLRNGTPSGRISRIPERAKKGIHLVKLKMLAVRAISLMAEIGITRIGIVLKLS